MPAEVFARYANQAAKTYMTMDEAFVLSTLLAKNLVSHLHEQNLERPDAIVGIATGGLMVAKIIALEFGVPLEVLFIRRKGSGLKRALGKLPFLVPLASRLLSIRRVRTCAAPILSRLNSLETGTARATSQAEGTVIIVDDCIETGSSILHAKNLLLSRNRRVLATAVLALTDHPLDPAQRARLDPLVHLLPRIHHFPWSQNNSEYPQFLAWLEQHSIRPW